MQATADIYSSHSHLGLRHGDYRGVHRGVTLCSFLPFNAIRGTCKDPEQSRIFVPLKAWRSINGLPSGCNFATVCSEVCHGNYH